jgi:hypothetical protein
MGHPKPEPARLTVAQLAELQSDADGFRGRFVFVVGHECDDCDGIDNALIFEAHDNDLAGCAGWHTIIDDLDIGCADDHEAGEALARMLNATAPLLSMLKRES